MIAAVEKTARASARSVPSGVDIAAPQVDALSKRFGPEALQHTNSPVSRASYGFPLLVRQAGTCEVAPAISWECALDTTVYLYDGVSTNANAIEEVDNTGNVLARYTGTKAIDESLAELRSGITSYYQVDALGSVTSLSNPAGTLANTYTYDSFGKLAASTGTLVNPFQYTGRDNDSETGLRYYRARYYDQTIGRFISEDPIRFAGSYGFYVYTRNRPVDATDPTGLWILVCSRGGFQNASPSGIGNRSYYWDTFNMRSCGRGDQSENENPTTPGTFCRLVPGSDYHENNVMRCCQSEDKNPGRWFPWWNDCHTLTSNCLIMNNLPDVGTPGGRAGCRGNCPGYPQHEHFMSGW